MNSTTQKDLREAILKGLLEIETRLDSLRPLSYTERADILTGFALAALPSAEEGRERHIERLTTALRFYADTKNWETPSTGFAAQYDPAQSKTDHDRGNTARTVLAADGVTFSASPSERAQRVWLWKNGDHYLAYDNLHPTRANGDPAVLGEPAYTAIILRHFTDQPTEKK